jgi:hypothetical protein
MVTPHTCSQTHSSVPNTKIYLVSFGNHTILWLWETLKDELISQITLYFLNLRFIRIFTCIWRILRERISRMLVGMGREELASNLLPSFPVFYFLSIQEAPFSSPLRTQRRVIDWAMGRRADDGPDVVTRWIIHQLEGDWSNIMAIQFLWIWTRKGGVTGRKLGLSFLRII